jgi:tetratricopeptide (TPR) repeat protein
MAQLTIQQAFDVGMQHHQAGRLREAETFYRQVLALQPMHADATHLLGVIAHQVGRSHVAVDLIRQAIALRPNFPIAQFNLGVSLKEIGRLDEAVKAFQAAIALKPDYADAYSNLAVVLGDNGQLDDSISAFHRAIALRPDDAESHSNLGVALGKKGRTGEAIAAFHRAITLRGNYAEAYENLGVALGNKGQLDNAIAAYRQAIALNPNLPQAQNYLGFALIEKGQLDEAIAALEQAVTLRPGYTEALSNLGVALYNRGQPEQAVAVYRQAIAHNPNLSEVYNNLGSALMDVGRLDEAVAAFRQAISLNPSFAEAHHNLSFALLQQGDFQIGWREHEWRLKCKNSSAARNFDHVQWDGSPLEARSILLHVEQGVGDTIHFIRYLPLVARQAGKVIVECQPELRRLFESQAWKCSVVVRGEPLPHFDVHCPLPSLPLAFGTTLETIPNSTPYLKPDPMLIENWRQKIDYSGPQLKVGLVWAGNPEFKKDRTRSLDLQRLAPLAQVRDVQFFSFQKGPAAKQMSKAPEGLNLIDLARDLNDFADTAAAISLMDLVITTDTSVPHLAGALGKTVWVMLEFMPYCRWLLDREDSPWYPTMRLFRQPSPGDWDSVLARVVDALSHLVKNRT